MGWWRRLSPDRLERRERGPGILGSVDGKEDRLFDIDGDGLSAAERREMEKAEAKWWIARAKATLPQSREYVSRQPCTSCQTTEALVVPSNGQNVVRCARCGRSLYNAPKTETGERPRTVTTLRQQIKPSQQARILDRDHRTCVLCGRSDQPLVIGHLLSIEEGVGVGASEAELYDDANLAAMCEACNSGLSRHSISPRTYAVIMLHLVRAERRRSHHPATSVRGVADLAPEEVDVSGLDVSL